MPYTVNTSFSQYRESTVDLDREEMRKARNSRDFLKERISRLADIRSDFPKITKDYLAFGSFARNTKVRPLDDIDIMVILNGSNTTEVSSYSSIYSYRLQANNTSYLWQFTDEYGYVNSTRILNRFRDGLSSISNYRNATINRRMQAVVLNLVSYAWSFDIVPAVPIGRNGTREYFLIPDGRGNWIRTDPRRDQTFITDANKRHNSNLIPLIRLLKYWNMNRYSPPKIGSYYLETMIINGFKWASPISNIKNALPDVFRNLGNAVTLTCADPKGLGPNLDESSSWDTRKKVQEVAYEMAKFADYALRDEQNNNHKSAVDWWNIIFPNFPKYG
jgi:predicted nucleotidyltransferase